MNAHLRSTVCASCCAFLMMCGCESKGSIEVAEETLGQAPRSNFPYATYLARAERGDPDALGRLLEFSTQVDAAGSIGHGVVMVELLYLRGDQDFASALAGKSTDVKYAVFQCLDAGEAYGRNERIPQPLSAGYPFTFSVLNLTD